MKLLLLTTDPSMDDVEMAISLFKAAGFSCDMATSESQAYEFVKKNRYAVLWVENSADKVMGSDLRILFNTIFQSNPNACIIGHRLTHNNWIPNTNRINRSYHDGDWYNTLRGLYSQIKNVSY